MSTRTLPLDDALYDYLLAASLREPPILERLRAETSGMTHALMQISPEQGQFMALLIKLIDARRCLEVGTFTGYSSLAVALASRVPIVVTVEPALVALRRGVVGTRVGKVLPRGREGDAQNDDGRAHVTLRCCRC